MKGISLIEVLIALTILSITVLCTMGAMLNSLRLSQQGFQEVCAISDSMTAFEQQQYGLANTAYIES